MNTRRTFLRAALAGATAPMILPSRIFGADAPSKRINIGMIGIGRQAYNPNLTQFLGEKDCHVMAVCDVDAWRLEQGRLKIQEHYDKAKVPSACKTYKDFRNLLADKDIDAVMISTPDHWHADAGGRGGRPAHHLALPYRPRLHQTRRREAALGPGEGGSSRRRGGQRAAPAPTYASAVETGVRMTASPA